MFIIHLPKSFKIGDTVDCRINREPARVTWRDKDILVIGDNDVRKIITSNDEGGLLCFICGDADNATKYEVTKISDEGFVVSAKSERDQK